MLNFTRLLAHQRQQWSIRKSRQDIVVLIVYVQVFAIATLLNCRHQIGNGYLLQRAQMLKARGLQGKPFEGGIAIICRRLAGARFTPEFFSLQTRLTVEGKRLLHVWSAMGDKNLKAGLLAINAIHQPLASFIVKESLGETNSP